MCVCVHMYRKLFAFLDTEDDGTHSDDSDHVDLPPVKFKQVCLIYTEVKTTKGMCVVIGNNLS